LDLRIPGIPDISPQAVKTPLQATTKMAVIDELLDLLSNDPRLVDKDTAFQDIMAREAQSGTGLEHGIAVPHAKTRGVSGLLLAAGIAPRGVDFGSMDGEPSRFFLLILAPPDQGTEHLNILREIAFMASDTTRRTRLLAAATSEELRMELMRRD
jgi:mannitol/fructose-specific phosphotransferase system IIA component (Ntr-type)